MSERVIYLHLGAPKTGTTFLQAMLGSHRERLLEDGIFCPGRGQAAHHRAARDLRNVQRHRRKGKHSVGNKGEWDRLVRHIRGWDGTGVVVVSSELLAFATRQQADRALASLGPAEVHLVLTVRDLVRQVPAVWQESVKNRSALTYDEFVRRLVDADVPWRRGSWGAQEPVTVLERWGSGIPPERVHVVTVPPRGADAHVLWQRFAGVLGADPGTYPPAESPANTSLGVAETEVVRRLNEKLQKAPWPFYAEHVKHGIARGVLAGRSDGARLLLPEGMLPWAEQRSKEIIASLSAGGYDVVGDLDDLLPPADGAGVGRVPEPDPERLASASTAAAGYLAGQFATTWRSARRRAKEGAEGPENAAAARSGARSPQPPSSRGRRTSRGALWRAYRAGRRRLGR